MFGTNSFTTGRLARLPLLALILAASGCATLNENECMYADWYAIGIEDGTRGQGMDRLGSHRKACAEYGVIPDTQSYGNGRDEGLKHYCTLSNGLRSGKSGSYYRGVCPAQLETDFMDGYQLGKRIHSVRSNLNSKQYEIDQIEELLASEEIEEKEEYKLQYDLRDLEREVGRLQYELELLEHEEQTLLF